jgi:hypothetical protein
MDKVTWVHIKNKLPEKNQVCWVFGSADGESITINNFPDGPFNKFDTYPCLYNGKDFLWPAVDNMPIKFVIWWAPRIEGHNEPNPFLPDDKKSRWDIDFEDILAIYGMK